MQAGEIDLAGLGEMPDDFARFSRLHRDRICLTLDQDALSLALDLFHSQFIGEIIPLHLH